MPYSGKNIDKSVRFKRYMRAQYRYMKILLYEFKWSLSLFIIIISTGAICINSLYDYPNRSFLNSLSISLHLMFLDQAVDFPDNNFLEALFLLLPIVGFGVVAEGLVRFMVLLFNKKNKKEVWQMALASTMSNHIIVCGLGRVGYRVVQRLLRLGEDIAIIENNTENTFFQEMENLRIPVIKGRCEDRNILSQARIKLAKSLVVVTNNDLVNIEVALMAKELNPDIKIILRVFNPNLCKFISNATGIRTFSTSDLAAPAFASAVFSDHIIHAIDIDGTEANMARYNIPEKSAFIGRTIDDIENEYDITFILHQNTKKRDVHPAQDIVLAADDLIIFLAPLDQLVKIEKHLVKK